jgi:hypothetical protein
MGKNARISLQVEEWTFPLLEKAGEERGRDYELGREAVRAERIHRRQLGISPFDEDAWLEDRVVAIRHAWRLQGRFTPTVPENPIWFTYPPTQVLVLYPEWPDTPYLKIDLDERLRRLGALSIPTTEADRLSQFADLLNPLNFSTGEKSFVEIAIPKNLNHEELSKAFAALLKVDFPAQGKGKKRRGKSPYAKQQGRGSERACIGDDLNALAAYRLRRIAKLPRSQVISLIKHPDSGDPVYSEEKQLDKPLRRIPGRIQKFWEEAMANLTPLEPLGLSQPDFDSL